MTAEVAIVAKRRLEADEGGAVEITSVSTIAATPAVAGNEIATKKEDDDDDDDDDEQGAAAVCITIVVMMNT